MGKNKGNIEVGVNVDTTELKETINLVRKLKFEVIEVNKQFKKLGLPKREVKKFIKNWRND